MSLDGASDMAGAAATAVSAAAANTKDRFGALAVPTCRASRSCTVFNRRDILGVKGTYHPGLAPAVSSYFVLFLKIAGRGQFRLGEISGSTGQLTGLREELTNEDA